MAAVPALTPPARDAQSAATLHLAQSLRDRVQRIERRAARDDAGGYADGCELAAIEEGRLWRHGGYRGMNDFLQRGLHRLPASTARQRWQVARRLPRDFVCAHGLLKCYFGLRILALEGVPARPAALECLAIEAERDGRMAVVPFALASTNEVRRAAARRRPCVDPLRGLPPGWRARLRPLVRALRPYDTPGGSPSLSVSTRGRAPERALVRMSVPLDQLEVLYRAIGEVLGVRAATGRATGRAIKQAARPPARSPGPLTLRRPRVPRATPARRGARPGAPACSAANPHAHDARPGAEGLGARAPGRASAVPKPARAVPVVPPQSGPRRRDSSPARPRAARGGPGEFAGKPRASRHRLTRFEAKGQPPLSTRPHHVTAKHMRGSRLGRRAAATHAAVRGGGGGARPGGVRRRGARRARSRRRRRPAAGRARA